MLLLLSLRGRVAYWRVGGVDGAVPVPLLPGHENVMLDLELGTVLIVEDEGETTVIWTKSPERRIRPTTCSCDADDTSSPLI